MATTTDPSAAVLGLVDGARKLVVGAGRDDLAQRLAVAGARVRRPGTVVCVVGEFKQGKSSLVNALVDRDACPVDDDLATCVVTIVHHAAEPAAVVRRATDDGVEVARVGLDEVRGLVTEAGNPGNVQRVERLDLGLPEPLLERGLTLVDTPGVGGLGGGNAAATLGFLPYADAMLFTTDASRELTRPEVDLLHEARERCPLVVCVLTKVDLHPHWRAIAELNRGHLDRAGVDVPIVPVSAALHRRLGADAPDRAEAGIDALLAMIEQDVVARARREAVTRAAGEVTAATGQLRTTMEGELAVLRDPEAATELERTVEEAKQRLAHLRGPAAGWRNVLGDRIQDLTTTSAQELRRLVRGITRELDDQLAELRSTDDWERISRDLQARVAEAVTSLFGRVREAGDELRDELAQLLAVEDLGIVVGDLAPEVVDVSLLWGDRSVKEARKAVAADGLTAVRGVQSGVLMFGMVGRMLPAAAGALVASNPILLGAGLLLGGKAVRDQRERRVAQQRQEARAAIRQFLDDVQFELGPQLQEACKALQREVRDTVQARITELQATWTETGRQAQAALTRDQSTRAERIEALEAGIATAAQLSTTAARLTGPEADQ